MMGLGSLRRIKPNPLLAALLSTFVLVSVVYYSLDALIDWQVRIAIQKDAEIRSQKWTENFFETTPSVRQMIESGVAPEKDFTKLENSFVLTGVIRIKLFDSEGMLAFMSDNGVLAPTQFFSERALGVFDSGDSIVFLHAPEEKLGHPEHLRTYVEIYTPAVLPSGERIGVVEVYLDVSVLEAALQNSFRQISGYLIAGTIVVLLIPAGAYVGITRQIIRKDRQFLEFTRYDQLTGALSRNSISGILTRQFSEPQTLSRLGVLFVDIDHFKQVNDKYGHSFGDSLLRHISHILMANLHGKSDAVGRFGGDEFVVLCPNINPHDFRKLYGRVMDVAQKAFQHDGNSYIPSLSIGAYLTAEGDTEKTALHRADLAVYAAKRNGRGQVFEYSEELEGLFAQEDPKQTA